MYKGLLFALVCITLLLTSCQEYNNDVYINEDGSGRLETEFDLSGMLSMMAMMSELDTIETVEEEDEELEIDINNPDNFLNQLLKKGSIEKDYDTIFTMLSLLPDSLKERVEDPTLMEKMHLKIVSSQEAQQLKMTMLIDFENEKEIDEILEAFMVIREDTTQAIGPQGIEKVRGMFIAADGEFTKGKIVVLDQDFEQEMMDDDMAESEEFLEMMFGESEMVTTYHLPGKVISVSDPQAIKVDDNTVQFKLSMMEVAKEKKFEGYTITYETKNKSK